MSFKDIFFPILSHKQTVVYDILNTWMVIMFQQCDSLRLLFSWWQFYSFNDNRNYSVNCAFIWQNCNNTMIWSEIKIAALWKLTSYMLCLWWSPSYYTILSWWAQYGQYLYCSKFLNSYLFEHHWKAVLHQYDYTSVWLLFLGWKH